MSVALDVTATLRQRPFQRKDQPAQIPRITAVDRMEVIPRLTVVAVVADTMAREVMLLLTATHTGAAAKGVAKVTTQVPRLVPVVNVHLESFPAIVAPSPHPEIVGVDALVNTM